MPFLLLWWKPIAGLLAVLALFAFVGIEKHSYDERRRDEGRAEVRAADAQRLAEADARWAAQVKATESAALKAMEVNNANATALQDRARHLAGNRPVSVSAGAAGLLIDAARVANGQAPAAEPKPGTDPVPDATVEYSEADFAGWAIEAGKAYRDATDLFHEARSALITCLKGTP